MQLAALDGASQWFASFEQARLPDDLVQLRGRMRSASGLSSSGSTNRVLGCTIFLRAMPP